MGKGKGDLGECCAFCGPATRKCCVVLVLCGLGLAKIVMGAVFLHDCSIERRIPIYLFVSGLSPVLFSGFGRSNNVGETQNSITVGTFCNAFAYLFNLAWLICGSVWVYPNYGVVTTDGFTPCTETGCTKRNCNRTLITFAFGMVTLDWVLMGLSVVLIGCMVCRSCMK